MSRYLILLLALNIQGFASIAYASNDLDKWNSEKGKVIRSELKSKLTTTYKEKPNPLHTDSTYKASDNGGKVLTKLETKAEIKGSRVGATIEALKQVDKTAVAKKWAKEFAKGGVRFAAGAVLIEVAMNEMLNGIGWIIDEGGNVTKKNDFNIDATNTCANNWKFNNDQNSLGSAINNYRDAISRRPSQYARNYSSAVIQGCNGNSNVVVQFKYTYCQSDCSPGLSNSNTDQKTENIPFSPSSITGGTAPTNERIVVPQQEIEQKINDYFNDPKSPSSKDLLIEQAVKPKGKASIMWSDDPSSEQTIFSDNKGTAERILNSDNPQGEGLTKTTPKIDDGTTVDADTTPKPNPETPYKTDPTTGQPVLDPTTGQPVPNPNYNPDADTGSTTSFSLPAFCSWASVVCEWLDWTKEMPEDEEQKEEENINDRGIFNRELDTDFNLEGSCPPDFTFQMTNKYFAGSYTIPLNWLCISFTFIGYALIFLSNCIGMWILYETVTRKELRF